MDTLRSHEALAMFALLAGDHPVLVKLRLQAEGAAVTKRTHTGVGEYVDFEVGPENEPVEPDRLVLADVNIQVEGVRNGADALLFVIDGRISFLEFATAADEWPRDPVVLGASYYREVEAAPGSYSLEPCNTRDAATVARALKGGPSSAA